MTRQGELLDLLGRAVAASQAQATEIHLAAADLAITRWNQNHIHQNLARQSTSLTVRCLDDGRMGLASTSRLEPAAIAATIERAVVHARLQSAAGTTPGLPPPGAAALRPPVAGGYHESTAACQPGERAAAAGVVIAAAQQRGLQAAGTFATSVHETAVVNSLGLAVHHAGTKAFVRTIISGGDTTGYADQLSADVRDLDYAGLAQEAVTKATLHDTALDLPPGRYDTIFEPVALADLVRFLGYLSFSAKAVQEGRSFMGPLQGQKVMSEHVTIWDDGLDPRGLVRPFDAEGVAKQKVVMIDRGVVGDVVHDCATAAREGRTSTGHATPHGRWLTGPLPHNMLMAPGTSSRDEMIAATGRGVLVARFHYTHAPEPVRVVATGTTRDGTFLIEDGQIVARLRNLRFTESMIEALARVDLVSSQARLARDWWSTFESWLPAVRVRDFTFSGATTF